jgi:outer membrane protein
LTKNLTVLSALLLGGAALASAQTTPPAKAPTKAATINVQAAILGTKEGQKAAQDLQNKFTTRKQALEKKQSDLAAMQSRMRAGSATMSQQAKDKLIADIDSQTKEVNRESEDFNNDVQQEESKIMNDVGTRMLDLIEKYSTQHDIFMVADVSNPRTPVLWANPSGDITNDIIKLYDETNPVAAPAPAPATAPAPLAPKKK